MFLIYCVDRPNSDALRAKVRPDHLAYLQRFKDKIAIGGPILDEQQSAKGTVLIMDFADQDSVHRFLEDEPYRKNGLFETTLVRPWRGVTGAWLPEART